MVALGGANSAADLVHDVLIALHNASPGDLTDASFAVPRGYAPAPVCAGPEETPQDRCSHSLLAWVPQQQTLSAAEPARPDLVTESAIQLSVLTPEAGTRVWRNPESPPAANRLVLRARTTPHVPQIVWYVDGEPFAVTDPDQPVSWPMQGGEHRFQIGLPLRSERSRSVKLLVQ
jgi:penicillin-binding protein 1C